MTNSIFGMSKLFHKIIAEYGERDVVVVVFDAPGDNFRHRLLPTYKANRKPMPPELSAQLPIIKKLVDAFGFKRVEADDVEADDVIATLALRAASEDWSVTIASIDKDLCQLIGGKVVMDGFKGAKVLDADGVLSKYGVRPDQIIDYLCLVGDSSDNIPGVPGVGPKTAAKWLGLFESIDGIYQCLHQIPSKSIVKLNEMRDALSVNKKLITLKTNVELLDVGDFEELKWQGIDFDVVEEMYSTYRFNSLMMKLSELRGDDTPLPLLSSIAKNETPELRSGYNIVASEEELRGLLTEICSAKLVALDLETTSLDYVSAEIVGISFCWQSDVGYYVPVAKLGVLKVIELLRAWLESAEYKKVGHHLKYDRNVLKRYDVELAGIAEDSMLLCHLYGKSIGSSSLDVVTEKYLSRKTISYKEVLGSHDTFSQVDEISAANYAIEDSLMSFSLASKLSLNGQEKIYRDIEVPLIEVLSDMESYGVLVDANHLEGLSKQFSSEQLSLEKDIYKIVGKKINLSSPKQVSEVLYDTLDCPVLAKTPSGAPSTSESVLELLAGPAYKVEMAALLLQHREITKLLTTYTLPLVKMIAKDGRIHTSYHQSATVTGRLSSAKPNLQNIPIGSTKGAQVREAFIARDGWSLVSADYSQIELRVMAHLSKDVEMVRAFVSDEDIHTTTAGQIFAVEPENVTDDMRRSAKTINFGLIYGMGEYGLSQRLRISREQAKEYRDKYFARFSGVHDYMEKCKQHGKKHGTITTLHGREIQLTGINSARFNERSRSERLAINAPVQGSSAEIIKLAMLQAVTLDMLGNGDARLLMQVHDELVFEVKDECIDTLLSEITTVMENSMQLEVPLKVSVGAGKNWFLAH